MPRGKASELQGAVNGAVATASEAPALVSASARVMKTAQDTPPKRPASRLPPSVQFLHVVGLSLSSSILAHALLNGYFRREVARVAKQPESNAEAAFLVAWRLFELALGWYGNYDTYDLAALNLLSHSPAAYLLVAFYGADPWVAAAHLAIDTLSGSIPFLVLRPLSGLNSRASSVSNKEIIQDRGIQTTTAVLSGLIYGATLFVAFKTYLPTVFVLYFEGITRVEPAVQTRSGSLLTVALILLLGIAGRGFIFTPFAAANRTAADEEVENFDPVSATLGQTLWWNLWGYTTRTKVAIRRTVVVTFTTWVSTYLQCAMTVRGVESYGAAVYASAWAMAAMLTGLGLEVVGDV